MANDSNNWMRPAKAGRPRPVIATPFNARITPPPLPHGLRYIRDRIFLTAFQKHVGGRYAHVDPNFSGYRAAGGWKIHVSATPYNATAVAQLVLPILVRQRVWHKFVPVLKDLASMHGIQAGKFITIYPNPDNTIAPDGWEQIVPLLFTALVGSGLVLPIVAGEDYVTPEGDVTKKGCALPRGLSMRQVVNFNTN